MLIGREQVNRVWTLIKVLAVSAIGIIFVWMGVSVLVRPDAGFFRLLGLMGPAYGALLLLFVVKLMVELE